jgi:gas vesicle protein
MAKVTLGKESFDLPDSCSETAKTLKEAVSALADYAKSGNSEKLRALWDKIIKTAIPNDLKKAKDDKDAKKSLDEVKKAVEKYQKGIATIGKVEEGKP